MTARAITLAALASLALACARRLEHPVVQEQVIQAQVEDDAPAAFAALTGAYERLLRIGERLRRANTDACSENVVSSLGWLALADRDFGGLEMRKLAARFVNADKRPVVLALSPDGAAQRAGIRVGDQIVSVARRKVRTAVQTARAEKTLPREGESVVIERDGGKLALPVSPERACRGDVYPSDRHFLGAEPRGDTIYVGLDAVELASDDALAFTIAHAMAQQLLGIDPWRFETPEPKTTALAVELSERAGFAFGDVEAYLELSGIEQPWRLMGHRLADPGALWHVNGEFWIGDIPRRIVALRQVLAQRARSAQ